MVSDSEDDLESEEEVVSMEDTVDSELMEDWRSRWDMVYFVVVISSSRGVRNETRFSAGKRGRADVILRGIRSRAGLLVRMEVRLCGCL